MKPPSQKFVFDNRLLAVEELFRQRQYEVARSELGEIPESEFTGNNHEAGLYLALHAEADLFSGNYRRSLDEGLQAVKILADLPLNRRFGRLLLTLSKCYSALGDLKNAEIRARDALASFRRAADAVGQVDAFNELARTAFIRCDYAAAVRHLDDAIEHAAGQPRKIAQLTGNVGRIRLELGEWQQAEDALNQALAYNREHNEEISEAVNLLSLGKLYLRRRDFAASRSALETAHEVIKRLDLKREEVIYLEFAGELAFERGDTYRAKAILTNAYQEGRMLAPESALVSQSVRRLAEVELVLDNYDDAMKYGQKALEIALQLGEKLEVGLAQRVIARVFAARSEYDDALEYVRQAERTVREVGDPVELARTLLIKGEIAVAADRLTDGPVVDTFDEASRLFRKLGLEFWHAEAEFRAGTLACRVGDLASGFRRLNRAEKMFVAQNETGKVRSVQSFLRGLSDQAVALAASQENEFKVFGNLVSPAELTEVKEGHLEDILQILMRRTNANRAIICEPTQNDHALVSSAGMTDQHAKRFIDTFRDLLGEEISTSKPTLKLDCRRDPYINELFTDTLEPIASVVVVPFKMSDKSIHYLYLDKLSPDNTLQPFTQAELNFAVAFSDIIAFKLADLQKSLLYEDNLRLKQQIRQEAAFPNIITHNGPMLEMLAQVRQVVDSSISVTIEGETGSGKDLLARAIHYNSNRRDKRFVSVNCAALPETLLESELFGYRRGAFTGADRDKTGLIEEADGGTFFLDEIGDMPLSIQAKILRVLEEKELVRLGETSPRKVDVRIVSATNKSLKEEIEAGRFRRDLYYRLSALTFRLPPLRERKEDIPLLAGHFLRDSQKRLSTDVLSRMAAYDWPGNIRELENEIQKMILLAGDSNEIGTDVLSGKINVAAVRVPETTAPSNGSGQLDAVEFTPTFSLYDYLDAYEKRFIMRALQRRDGVKKHAAADLNIPESTLRLKIKQYDIDLARLDAAN